MPLRFFFFSLFIGVAGIADFALGTSNYPTLLIMACAIVTLYELVSPYIYTPS